MKVLQIHNIYRTRGGEESVVQSERQLLEMNGHEVVPFYRDSRDIDNFGPLERARILATIPYSRVVEREICAVVHEQRPDVAHVHNVFPLLTSAVYRALRRCEVPVVQTIHNFRFLCPNGLLYIDNQICEACTKHGYFSAVRKRCMHRSTLISGAYAAAIALAWRRGILPNDINSYIALNRFFADRLIIAGVPESRIRILGNFISDIADHVSPKSGYLLYLGRLSREKGIRTLLDALREVEGIKLKIAGSGPLAEEIKAQVAHIGDGKVEMLGHVSGVAKYELIRDAKCMVVPSEWYENFPISVVESMSLGTPVVASRIGGLPEMVEDGVTGLLFEPGYVNELAAVLRRIVSDGGMLDELAENALRTAKEKFGAESHYDGLIDVYNDAISTQALGYSARSGHEPE